MKGVESAAWPWLYPVQEFCDSVIVETLDGEGKPRSFANLSGISQELTLKANVCVAC